MDLMPSAHIAGGLGSLRVEDVLRPRFVSIPEDFTLRQAARTMLETNSTYAIVERNGEPIGIVTDTDLKRALAEGVSLDEKVSRICKRDLISIRKSDNLLEAIIKFFEHNIKHLVVLDDDGKLAGVLSVRDVLYFLSRIPLDYMDMFSRVENIEDLKRGYELFEDYLRRFLLRDETFDPILLGKMISHVNDQVISRAIELSIRELGRPPCSFVFLVMGSEGRQEQLLKTDQDNSMIFREERHRDYFVDLGKLVHENLLKIGFPDCPGGYTTGNEEWVLSLEKWYKRITYWESVFLPENIMNLAIFTDMRAVYGDRDLFNRARDRILRDRRGDIVFAKVLEQSLGFRPPVRFGRITSDIIDVKKHAIAPIVFPVRALSFGFNIRVTNTKERIEELGKKEILSEDLVANLVKLYSFFRRLQVRAQLRNIERGENGGKREKENELDLRELPSIEASFVKSGLKFLAEFHDLLSWRYLSI